jgi:hypothetical protein
VGLRAMDTLLEKVVLLLALVGVWSLAPDRVWEDGRSRDQHQAHPSAAHRRSSVRPAIMTSSHMAARMVPP